MADIFTSYNTKSLLRKKFVLILGDSNLKYIYKDILFLIQTNEISLIKHLNPKNSNLPFCGDIIVDIATRADAGRDYFEERDFESNDIHIRFQYLTKLFGKRMTKTIADIENGRIPIPSIIILNSFHWDISRWGPNQVDFYKSEMCRLFAKLKEILPPETLIIWMATLPTSKQTKGSLLVQQVEFIKYSLRFSVLEANKFTQQLCCKFGLDFLDLHYFLRFQLHRRAIDGIHWDPQAVRFIVNCILTHIAISLKAPLPNNVNNLRLLQNCVNRAENAKEGMNSVEEQESVFSGEMQQKLEKKLKELSLKTSTRENLDRLTIKARRRMKSDQPMSNRIAQSQDGQLLVKIKIEQAKIQPKISENKFKDQTKKTKNRARVAISAPDCELTNMDLTYGSSLNKMLTPNSQNVQRSNSLSRLKNQMVRNMNSVLQSFQRPSRPLNYNNRLLGVDNFSNNSRFSSNNFNSVPNQYRPNTYGVPNQYAANNSYATSYQGSNFGRSNSYERLDQEIMNQIRTSVSQWDLNNYESCQNMGPRMFNSGNADSHYRNWEDMYNPKRQI